MRTPSRESGMCSGLGIYEGWVRTSGVRKDSAFKHSGRASNLNQTREDEIGIERRANCLQGNDLQVGDHLKAAQVGGSRWLSIAASTSLAKSASMTAVESSGKSAMHSEIERRGGTGRWITATGSLPLSLSITTFAPARTRASTDAKSLAASFSEMWITP